MKLKCPVPQWGTHADSGRRDFIFDKFIRHLCISHLRARSRYYVAVLKLLEFYLRKHRLIRAGERVGVAVSGGADSVALLRALAELAPVLGVVPFVLHLNHGLRGEDADADEQFVRELAARLSLEAAIESEDVASLAALFHLSLEAAGRRARYAFFQRAAATHRLDCVATAHTRDDQAETILLRLLRGAGTSGLAGIHRTFELSRLTGELPFGAAAQEPRLIRPLLSASRQQIEQYLEALGQPFRRDSSNLSPEFLRNRVRAGLLPELERDYNPRLRQALCETAEIAAAENVFFEERVSSALGPDADFEQGMELPLLQAQPLALQRRILRGLCQPFGLALDFSHLEALREFALAGRAERLRLPRGFFAEVVREPQSPARLFLRPPEPDPPQAEYAFELPVPGAVSIGRFFGGPETSIRATLLGEDSATLAYNRAHLVRAKLAEPWLSVRNLQPGDRYHPLFSSGERKVNRLLQGLSIPGAVRGSWPVVLAGDSIVWAPGLPVAAVAAWSPGDGDAISLEICNATGSTCNTFNTLFSGRSALSQHKVTKAPAEEKYDIVVSEAQLQTRISALGRRISRDYQGRSIYCVGVLENGFIFLADLLRSIQGNVRCQFVRTNVREILENNISTTEIFYTPEVDVTSQHVLLCEGIVSSGQTTEFLIRNLKARGAASIAVCTLLDRQSARRVDLEVNYYGFQVGPQWLAGFGLGSPTLERNLPFIFAAPDVDGLWCPEN
jgi:hypoxanthine phosphoribosyltransferase